MDLNTLEDETRRLLALLEHREPGLATWHWFFVERVRAIRALTEDVPPSPDKEG